MRLGNISLATNLYFSHTLQTHTPPMCGLQALVFNGLEADGSVLCKTPPCVRRLGMVLYLALLLQLRVIFFS